MASMKCLQTRTVVRSSRAAVVVRASAEPAVDRRALLGAFAAALGAAASLAAPQEASARKIASQAFTGGLVSGGGSVTKSSTLASSEGYVLEGYPGTRKPAYIKPEKKQKLLAKARAEAEAIAKK